MKILASRQYPTYANYRDSGEFTSDQLRILRSACEDNISDKKLSVLANPEYSPEQMQQIRSALHYLPLSVVLVGGDPRLSPKQMSMLFSILYSESITISDVEAWGPLYDLSPSVMRCLEYRATGAISEGLADALISLEVSDDVKFTILDNIINSGGDLDVNDIAKLDTNQFPLSVIEGVAYWLGNGSDDLILELYSMYPESFAFLDAADVDALCHVINNELWDLGKDLVSGKYKNAEQIEAILLAMLWVDEGSLSREVCYELADPSLTAEEIHHIRVQAGKK